MSIRFSFSPLVLWVSGVALAAACGGKATDERTGESGDGDGSLMGDGDGGDGDGDGDWDIGDGDGDWDIGDGDGDGDAWPVSSLTTDCDAGGLEETVTQPERAVRALSEALWGQPADAELLARVDEFELRGDLYQLALEMLDDEVAVRNGAGGFFPWWVMSSRSVTVPPKNADLFPQFNDASFAGMVDEVRALGSRALAPENDLSFSELLESRMAFGGEHAWVYEPGPEPGETFFETEERFGLFSSPLFASRGAYSELTAPAVRGRILREQLLCQDIPAPPEILDVQLDDYEETMRDYWDETVTSNPSCNACHVQVGQLGLGFEQFDAVGAFRTHDGEHLIDTFTPLADYEEPLIEFSHPRELMEYLARSPRTWECMGVKWFEYFFHSSGVDRRDPAGRTNSLVACAAEHFPGFRPSEFVALLAVSDQMQTSFLCGVGRCLDGEQCLLAGSMTSFVEECVSPDDPVDCDGSCDCSADEYGNKTADCRSSSPEPDTDQP